MDLILSSDQEQVVDTVRQFMADRLPVTRLHGRQGPADQTPAEIAREAAELGLFSMGLPEAAGGVGFGPPEEALVSREIGRTVGPARFLFSIIGAKVAAAAGDDALAQRIASGEVQVAYAISDNYRDRQSLATMRLFDYAGAAVAIVEQGDRFRLLDLAGVTVTPAPCIDPSVTMGKADLSAAPALADVSSPELRCNANLLVGAMELGLAEAVKDAINEYAKIRQTFGRPIGAYQAVRHPIAEMAARCALAEAQMLYASLTLSEGYGDAEAQTSAARLTAADAAIKNTQENIQLHGGIGVTDEFDAHFFLKRANLMRTWFTAEGRANEIMMLAKTRSAQD
jgi:alkylation response protein AidB-like acyl-CoA dehydrogenase